MENTESASEKLGLGIGIIALISGIALILSKNYVIGISGSIVAVGLIFQNLNKLKDMSDHQK